MKRFIEVDIRQAGQPRPYADEVYEAYLRFSSDSKWASRLSRESVLEHVPVLVHRFVGNPEWHEPRLELIEEVEPNYWHVRVIQPYLD